MLVHLYHTDFAKGGKRLNPPLQAAGMGLGAADWSVQRCEDPLAL